MASSNSVKFSIPVIPVIQPKLVKISWYQRTQKIDQDPYFFQPLMEVHPQIKRIPVIEEDNVLNVSDQNEINNNKASRKNPPYKYMCIFIICVQGIILFLFLYL